MAEADTTTRSRLLMPKFSKKKSFYAKAIVIESDTETDLLSYGTLVCRIDKKGRTYTLFKSEHSASDTTKRHITEFLAQEGLAPKQSWAAICHNAASIGALDGAQRIRPQHRGRQ